MANLAFDRKSKLFCVAETTSLFIVIVKFRIKKCKMGLGRLQCYHSECGSRMYTETT